MKRVGQILVFDAVQMHREIWLARSTTDLLVEAFGCWLRLETGAPTNTSQLLEDVRVRSGARRTYKEVAAAGFLVGSGAEDAETIKYFREGLSWLARRQPSFDGVPTGLAVDGVAFLGLVGGLTRLGDASALKQAGVWIASFLATSLALPGVPAWQKSLMRGAGVSLGAPEIRVDYKEDAPDAVLALIAQGTITSPEANLLEQAGSGFLTLLCHESDRSVEPERAALRLAAFRWLENAVGAVAGAFATAEDVCRLLHRLSAAFYRWTWEDVARTSRKRAEPRRWHIDNEYHLQNLLWVVLAPLFPDLKEEEFTESIGQLQPRTDLVIPSLALIIEAKFMYSRTTAREMIEQIAADSSLYLKDGSQYRHIIPVIWDEAARTEEHAMMIQGLKQLRGVCDVVVVSRPAAMRA